MINVVYNVATSLLHQEFLFVWVILLVCENSCVCVQTYQRMFRYRYVIPEFFCPYMDGVLLLHHLLFFL